MLVTRRNTLQWIGVTALGPSLPSIASQSPLCRIIGIGNAGCRIILRTCSSSELRSDAYWLEYACVSSGPEITFDVACMRVANLGLAPIRNLQLSKLGNGGDIDSAIATANTHRGALHTLVADADLVIIVAGVGGATGSGVSPIVAAMAREAGALALGVLVTPFKWELGAYPNSLGALKKLDKELAYMVALSNEATGNGMGENATLEEVIKQQELETCESLEMLLKHGIRFIKGHAGA